MCTWPQVRGANVLVTQAGIVRIVDLGHAVAGASRADMARDLSDMDHLLADPGWRGAQAGPNSTQDTAACGPTSRAHALAGGSDAAPGSRMVGGFMSYSKAPVVGRGHGNTHPRGPPPLQGVHEVYTKQASRALRRRVPAGIRPPPCRPVAQSAHRILF